LQPLSPRPSSQLLRTGGFCDFHARNLTGYPDGFAVAILGRDILEDRVPTWLSAYQERKFDALMKRASDFIEYSAYGRQEDFAKLSEADQVVWKELAASLRGSCS